MKSALRPQDAPFCPNLIIRRETLWDDVAAVVRHRCEMAITSVGAPDAVVEPLHEAGCLVFADVASVRHARKAIAAGVDGLVLFSAGAGGQTGWANGVAFVSAVRSFYDGSIVLAGGVPDGSAVFAAEVLGCDLCYMGTKFIATKESMAAEGCKAMPVCSQLAKSGVKRWHDSWSAGHSVPGVSSIPTVHELIGQTFEEYAAARQATRRLLEEGRPMSPRTHFN
jgi:nitronate monooxygenase